MRGLGVAGLLAALLLVLSPSAGEAAVGGGSERDPVHGRWDGAGSSRAGAPIRGGGARALARQTFVVGSTGVHTRDPVLTFGVGPGSRRLEGHLPQSLRGHEAQPDGGGLMPHCCLTTLTFPLNVDASMRTLPSPWMPWNSPLRETAPCEVIGKSVVISPLTVLADSSNPISLAS
jgi:hypothetical protein